MPKDDKAPGRTFKPAIDHLPDSLADLPSFGFVWGKPLTPEEAMREDIIFATSMDELVEAARRRFRDHVGTDRPGHRPAAAKTQHPADRPSPAPIRGDGKARAMTAPAADPEAALARLVSKAVAELIEGLAAASGIASRPASVPGASRKASAAAAPRLPGVWLPPLRP